jgi:hypothetical protein
VQWAEKKNAVTRGGAAHTLNQKERKRQPTNKQTQESARNASAALPNAKLIISAS